MREARYSIGRRVLLVGLLGGISMGLLQLARGGRLLPADVTFNNGAEVTSLDPATLAGAPGGRVALAMFEGLVVPHPETLEPLPGSARSWEVSTDGRTYTFQIREDAFWTNGDRLTAHDFVYSFERLLNPKTAATYAYLLWFVKGARRYTSEVDEYGEPAHDFETVAIRAENDHTLVVQLESPTPFFLSLLTYYSFCPVNRRGIEEARDRWPETWEFEWLRPENIVTNGPFRVAERRINDRIRLIKSLDYWDADHVAMRSIDILAIEHQATMLNMYLTGSVDFITEINSSLAPQMMPREDFVPRPYLATYFYRFNTTRPPFVDPRVRRALCLTIPRREICEQVLGMGQVPAYSLVPPLLRGYEAAECGREDAALARDLLRQAGFGAGGVAFPRFDIHYNTSEGHRSIAEAVAAAWRAELGIDVGLHNEEWRVFLDTQHALHYAVSRSSWISDYADPSSFTDTFVSGGQNNNTGWGDAEYDDLVERAAEEVDPLERMSLLRSAEAILMEQLPIAPVYHLVHQNVVAPRLGGLYHNVLDVHPAKFWYWMDDAELARKRAAQTGTRTLVDPHGPREGLYSPSGQGSPGQR